MTELESKVKLLEARTQYTKCAEKIAETRRNEAQLRERVAHYLHKFQCCANFLKRRKPKSRPYYSGPKVARIQGIQADAKIAYLEYKAKLDSAVRAGEWLRTDLEQKIAKLGREIRRMEKLG